MVAALLAPIFIGKFSQNDFFAQLQKIREQIQNVPQVVSVGVTDGNSTFRSVDGESTTITHLSTNVLINNQTFQDEEFAAKIANIVLRTHKDAKQRDRIQVVLTYGYDIGIASKWNRSRYSFAPEYWLAKKN